MDALVRLAFVALFAALTTVSAGIALLSGVFWWPAWAMLGWAKGAYVLALFVVFTALTIFYFKKVRAALS